MQEQAIYNADRLAEVLAGSGTPKVQVEVRLGGVWGEDPRTLRPEQFWGGLGAAKTMASKGLDIKVWVTSHARWLDDWVDILVSIPAFTHSQSIFCKLSGDNVWATSPNTDIGHAEHHSTNVYLLERPSPDRRLDHRSYNLQ